MITEEEFRQQIIDLQDARKKRLKKTAELLSDLKRLDSEDVEFIATMQGHHDELDRIIREIDKEYSLVG